ncbi:hypothetical protein HPB50_027921 [Hyalomma asiaticum]|nr:hypothetical protein HPB50_027921 [Hyalomma asiaticum]
MPTCSAPGCRSGYASAAANPGHPGPRHFFKPPKDPDLLKAWQNAIPRKNFKVTPKTYVCDIHFEPVDIISCYEHTVNGQTVTIPRGRWTLRERAVPRIFPNIPKHLSKPKVPKSARKPPKVRAVVPAQVASCQSDEDLYDETDACDGMDVDECTDVSTLETAPWLAVVQGSPTFDSWNVRASTSQVIFHKLEESGGVVYIEKAVVIRQDLAVEIGEHKINFDHYRRLQEVDGKQQLRVVPKLRKEHVSPDNLRKMNVRLAVQLFSRSTAIGLKVYQRLEEPDLKDCHGTAQFTLMVNNLFDALNVKLPQFGITSSSKEIEVIQEFLDAVNKTEENQITNGTVMFASQVTMESLRVTLASVWDLVTDLLSKGARYVLTGKLNQDPLEEAVRAKLAEISSTAQSETPTAPDHGYSTPAAQDCVIYYVCGYLVHSYLKHERCPDCVRSIQSENAECPEAFLTLEREFKHGSLKLPSWELFSVFRGIEAKISDELQENRLCSDTFWGLLDALEDCDITSVGCSVHKVTTTAELLHSYIVLRLHFATRDTCKCFISSEKVASARKKVKLM